MEDLNQPLIGKEAEPVINEHSYFDNRFLGLLGCTATIYVMNMLMSIGSPPGTDRPGLGERFQSDSLVPVLEAERPEFIK